MLVCMLLKQAVFACFLFCFVFSELPGSVVLYFSLLLGSSWLLLPHLFLLLHCVSSPSNSVQFNSVAQSCPTLCDPMNCSTPGLPVHHQLPEFTQTHVHCVSDAIQPSHPLSLLLLLPSIFPSNRIFSNIRVFSNESALCIRWPKY